MESKQHIRWFRNSAPYINAHQGKTFVLMFDGEATLHENFANVIHDIALLSSLGVRMVLVHGSRPQIASRLSERGIESPIVNGLRITNSAALQCVTEAAGAQRAKIEALLSTGLPNSPMHGAHINVCGGNYVTARPLGIHEGVDYLNTGIVRRIDTEGIQRQLDDNAIVLLSPIGYSPTGEIFNLSLEDIATQTAIALGADKLIVFGDESGLTDSDGHLVRQCKLSDARIYLEELANTDQYSLLKAACDCCGSGVERCHLISYRDDCALLEELFTYDGSGTLINHDGFEQSRSADIDDVGGILELIEPLEENGTLVKRSRELLETEIHHFTVLERDGRIVACAALYPYPQEKTGELACIVTHSEYRKGNRGERLLAELESQARSMGLNDLFVLTTQTAHWFIEQGFEESPIEQLPTEKQAFYNFQRGSKAFTKTLSN
jgi:amino-acid N-acetyltransferase